MPRSKTEENRLIVNAAARKRYHENADYRIRALANRKIDYAKNKDQYRSSIRRRIEDRKELVDSIKIEKKCLICEEPDPCALDFHHILDKKESISKLVAQTATKLIILKEIDKCIVLCSSCHRKLHGGSITMVVD